MIVFVWTRQAAADVVRGRAAEHARPTPSPREPLPFRVVTKQFARIEKLMPAEEVFARLGPQQCAEFREPEMDAFDLLVECHPERYPGDHFWAKWADPADPSRWVAVFFSDGRVYKTLKRGV